LSSEWQQSTRLKVARPWLVNTCSSSSSSSKTLSNSQSRCTQGVGSDTTCEQTGVIYSACMVLCSALHIAVCATITQRTCHSTSSTNLPCSPSPLQLVYVQLDPSRQQPHTIPLHPPACPVSTPLTTSSAM
jgi:hypothetical protein